MNDRELLEAAAKAAGIKALRDPRGVMRNCTGFDPAMNIFSAPEWSPLTDDGDALRLAVALRMNLRINTLPHSVCVEAYNGCAPSAMETLADVRAKAPDPYAATRRAIVRAAAAIRAD